MIKFKSRGPTKYVVLDKVRKAIDREFVVEFNEKVIEQGIKNRIAAGLSPVKGKRFLKYKDKDKYPKDKKPSRPVNLYLTGEMLKYYVAEFVSGVRIRVGITKSAPRDVKDRAEGNNIGTVSNKGNPGIPERRFVPIEGETFTVGIMRIIKNLYAERLASVLSTKKRRR